MLFLHSVGEERFDWDLFCDGGRLGDDVLHDEIVDESKVASTNAVANFLEWIGLK
jgi:hypothetical protein